MSVELSNAQQFISWMNTKSYLNTISKSAAKRFVKRGQVYWCHFGLNVGSEMSKATPRPAVIVSNFKTNKNSSNIIVVPVTHNASTLPYLVPIAPVTDGNGKVILDGQIDTANIICVSKARLGDLITTLSTTHMKADRNKAQDTLKQLRDIICQNGFDEKSQESIKKLLDIK